MEHKLISIGHINGLGIREDTLDRINRAGGVCVINDERVAEADVVRRWLQAFFD
jgi:hypothetical protein